MTGEEKRSSPRADNSAIVLIVEDETDLLELYAAWLADSYDVRTAVSGRDALDGLDESVDVILLDRKMPDLAGDTVLEKIRDRALDCRVAMVSAVEPDTDVIDLGFDDYLTKPVTKAELHATVDRLLTRQQYDARLQEYFALVSKRATLKSIEDVDSQAPGYSDLERRIADLERELEDTLDTFTNDDFRAVVYEVTGSPPAGEEPVDDGRPIFRSTSRTDPDRRNNQQ